MDRLENVKISEMRALLRLTNALHSTQDPLGRKRILIEGLCGFVHASAGSCKVSHVDPNSRRTTVVSAIEYRGPAGQTTTPAGDLAVILTAADTEDSVDSTLQVPNSAVTATVHLAGAAPGESPFSARQRFLVDLFHSEMTWVYQTDVLLTSPSALSLTRRERQTLEHLLEGLSEKQIASKLSLSQNTVHHYVKSIHKHFAVSSRSELLARWVAK